MKNTVLLFLVGHTIFLYSQQPASTPTLGSTTMPAKGPIAPLANKPKTDPKQVAASLALEHLAESISFYDAQVEEIKQSAEGIYSLIAANNEIISRINAVKKAHGILNTEQQIANLQKQINTAANNIYSHAIDSSDKVNFFKKINNIINEINNDALVQSNFSAIQQLELEVTRHIQKDVDSIRKIGVMIDVYTKDQEQKKLQQLSSQLNMLNAQLMTLRMTPDAESKLIPLEKQLQNYQSLIDDQISLQPIAMQTQIRTYKDAIKRYQLLLEYMRYPTKAATATEDEVALFDEPEKRAP